MAFVFLLKRHEDPSITAMIYYNLFKHALVILCVRYHSLHENVCYLYATQLHPAKKMHVIKLCERENVVQFCIDICVRFVSSRWLFHKMNCVSFKLMLTSYLSMQTLAPAQTTGILYIAFLFK